MSNFHFLADEWPNVFDATSRAEQSARSDPRAACFYARRALELALHWAFKHDPALKVPYQDNVSALLHEPTFKKTAGEAVFNKAKVIVTLGNRAVHTHRAIPEADALVALRELFHVAYWLAHTYARRDRPPANIAFDPNRLPAPPPTPRQSLQQLQDLAAQLKESDEKLSRVLSEKVALDEELQRLRAEVAAVRAAASATPDNHDYSESETRDYFIDLLLKEAGWALEDSRDREFEVAGMPNNQGCGYVDYVLWGDDGKPLALVEAKRTRRDSRVGQQQAKLYADCLEQQFGQRPIIFYSNGYEHWIWDDTFYPPRSVQGFYKQDELELAIQRRTSRKSLAELEINGTIVERYYQSRAIRRIGESFEKDHQRKALIVMATGAGKTRTVIALCEQLMRANWAKRILFLADRVSLVKQAVDAFKAFLPDASPVNLVTEKDQEGRVYASTYPTMMGLIDESKDGQRKFGVGHFDLVIIDEAHRSVFQKYRAIFEYFDSLLVGLTATPKDEVDRNTYSLFDLEDGVPTDSYGLDAAIEDGFLVPPKAVSVPLKFQRDGITYDELSEEEKEQWDETEWDEEGSPPPDHVDASALNKWLFNKNTVDSVLEHLMTRGQKVAGGDRLGKTIIFAAGQDHADYIAERFNANYPHYRGEFARVITFKIEYAQSLIDAFKQKEAPPHIAVSVDMMDTGIDVPEVVNLVFFKMVRSKTKFWQMVGRGTRLCPDLFGPGKDKEFFSIFDFCQNLEFFKENPEATGGSAGESLSARLFKQRLEVIRALDKRQEVHGAEPPAASDEGDPLNESEVRRATADLLHHETTAMNVDNFIVRPHRRLLEKYTEREAWDHLSVEEHLELAHEIAGLPTELDAEGEEAKRFDLLVLNLQLAILNSEPGFERMRDLLIKIAGLLEEKGAIPMVAAQMELIQDVQHEEWWRDVTIPMLERVRRRLRDLVKFIEKRRRKPIYTDFIDEMGTGTEIELPGTSPGTDEAKFRAKVRVFLRQHEDHIAIHKLRTNRPLTATDLEELERMLLESGVGNQEDLRHAIEESQGLGKFVRHLVGLDRTAAKEALGEFMSGKALNSNQIEFVDLVINHLTQHGTMEAEQLYESPFTDVTPRGPEGLFSEAELSELLSALQRVNETAAAA